MKQAVMVLLAVTLGLWTGASRADTVYPETAITLSNGGRYAVIDGDLHPGISDKIKALPASVQTLVLTSHGGAAQDSMKAAWIVRKRGITTYATGYCESACVYLFAGGTRRVAAAGTTFVVHGSVRPVLKGVSPVQSRAWDDEMNGRISQDLVTLGVDPRLTTALKLPRSTYERILSSTEAQHYRLATEVDGAEVPPPPAILFDSRFRPDPPVPPPLPDPPRWP